MTADSPHSPPRDSHPTNTGQSEQAQIISELQDHWRKVGYDAPIKSIERLEEAAKQLVGVNGTFITLYLAVFAFSDLRSYSFGLITIFFLAPMLLALGSIYFATQVYIPQVQPKAALDDISQDFWYRLYDTYIGVAQAKLKPLKRARKLLIASFAMLVLSIGAALLFPPAKAAPEPTPIIIVTPTLTSTLTPIPVPAATP